MSQGELGRVLHFAGSKPTSRTRSTRWPCRLDCDNQNRAGGTSRVSSRAATAKELVAANDDDDFRMWELLYYAVEAYLGMGWRRRPADAGLAYFGARSSRALSISTSPPLRPCDGLVRRRVRAHSNPLSAKQVFTAAPPRSAFGRITS